MPTQKNSISIEVAYAKPEQQLIIPVKVPNQCSAIQAIKLSGVLERFPELNVDHLVIGIFGKIVSFEQTLHNKDRVEIYRPLIADPKALRKQRATDENNLKKSNGNVT